MATKEIPPFMISALDNELLGAPSKSDGLGVQDIWAMRGRDLVPHLTSSTHYIQGFQILVEIFRLWEIFLQTKSHQVYADRFGKFFILIEQSFARIMASYDEEWTLPGARSVRARASLEPHISLDSSWQLLNNQQSNGLYGLYRGASGRAGLLQENLRQLSDQTMAVAQDKRGIEKSQEDLFSLVKQALDGKTIPIRKSTFRNLVAELVKTYRNPPLVDHFETMLIKSHDLTNRLVEGFQNFEDLDYQQFLTKIRPLLIKLVNDFKLENFPEHVVTINNVIACENLLAVVVFLFDWLCSQKGKKVEEITTNLPDTLHSELEPVLEEFKNSGVYTKAAKTNHSCFCDKLDTSCNLALLHSILEIHRIISERRKRALWVRQDEKGYLISDIIIDPPNLENLKVGQLWYHDYYLWPLRNIANQITELKK